MSSSSTEDVMELVEEIYEEVKQSRDAEKAEILRQALIESRDTVLASLPPPRAPNYYIGRLPLNGEAPSFERMLCCQPCDDDSPMDMDTDDDDPRNNGSARAGGASSPVAVVSEAVPDSTTPSAAAAAAAPAARSQTHHDGPTVSVRIKSSRNANLETTTLPAISLEGSQSPLPTGNTTIFLKASISIDDERDLSHVPYFGDDDEDHDDRVTELYNTESRERRMELGPEYKERETNEMIEEVLKRIQDKIGSSSHVNVHNALAIVMDVDVERIQYCSTHMHDTATPARAKKAPKESPYLEEIDSHRTCFCRRCFVYDCNMHGNLEKPSVELQGELALFEQQQGGWDSKPQAQEQDEMVDRSQSEHGSTLSDSEQAKSDKKSAALREQVARLEEEHHNQTELTDFQKAIIERSFLIHEGNVDEMAISMGAPRRLIAQYVSAHNLQIPPFKHVDPEREAKRSKIALRDRSMKGYNASWLKSIENAEIHPFFTPCDHEGPCSDDNCSCIKNKFFCTKHCGWGQYSRNFFRGCACKAGKCRTKLCSCYAANRECDPDLCRTCGACTDAPNQPATTQKCRNDSIGMRRHVQLLLAKSTIPDAGWGIFTKHALKKGDYIHEYVGEVISQEEAERRGRIYDKVNRSYLFNLSSDFVVDASRKGNKTRFANHSSSKPNCETRMVWVNGDIRLGFYAIVDIEPQTELFFNYRYDVSMENELIVKPGITVDWMKDPKMANKVSKKYAEG